MLLIPATSLDAMEKKRGQPKNPTVILTSVTPNLDPPVFSQNSTPEQNASKDSTKDLESFVDWTGFNALILGSESKSSEDSFQNLTPEQVEAAKIQVEAAKLLEEAIAFCTKEEGSYFDHKLVSKALDWVSKETITSGENATAKEKMAYGLRDLINKNKNDLEEIIKLIFAHFELDDTQARLKTTKLLVETKKILEQVDQRVMVGNLIINNDTVQLSELDLNNCIKAGEELAKQATIITGIESNFKLENMDRMDRIANRINEKSLDQSKIDYKPVDFKAIINQLTGKTNNGIQYGTVSNDGNDSDTDDETQTIRGSYSSSLWIGSDEVQDALICADQSTIAEGQDIAVGKAFSLGFQKLFEGNKIIRKDDGCQSEITKLKNSDKAKNNLELLRFILKNRIDGIQFDEKDLQNFSASCQREITEETDDLIKTTMFFATKRAERIEAMRHNAHKKLLQPDMDYKPLETKRSEIFTSAMQSFQELNDAAAKARSEKKELITETNES